MNKKKENKKFQTLTRCIGSTTYQLKVHFSENAKETVAIACGKKKAAAIAAALRTGAVDTLITDERTAEQILACC